MKKDKFDDLTIFHIRSVKTLVEKIYEDGSVFQLRSDSRKIPQSIESECRIFKLPKPKEIKIEKFSPSKVIELQNKSNMMRGEIVIKNSKHKILYHLLDKFISGSTGYYWGTKAHRYRDLYIVYEALTKKKNFEFSAVRHALSHFHLNDQKTLKIIKLYFNSTQIDLSKKGHRIIFTAFYKALLKDTQKIIVQKIMTLIAKNPQIIGHYIIV